MIGAAARKIEPGLAALALLAMAVLPALEIGLRSALHTGIPGSIDWVRYLGLWVGFLGAMLASRDRRHLAISSGASLLPGRLRRAAGTFAAAAAVCVASGLAWASYQMVKTELEAGTRIAGWVPLWTVQTILPAAFAVAAARFIWDAGGRGARAVATLGIPAAWAIGFPLAPHAAAILWPGIGALIAAAALGAPMFVALGGAALLLFLAAPDGGVAASIPVEAFRLIVSPAIPTLPLFALTGFLLAEGGASRRLLRLFQSLFGWMPGGLAVVATLVCAFLTTFTGASGVTILAVGGLLYPVLRQGGYREPFSLGLLTATGSLGLLFPPSLPVILYAVVAQVPIPDMFKAGALPGVVLVGVVVAYGIVEGVRTNVPRARLDAREAAAALWGAKWEVLLPVVALWGLFGGWCSGPVEAASLTVVYALFAGTVIHRDVSVVRDLPRVLVSTVTLIGGVYVILAAAMGLNSYLVDAQVPAAATEWVRAHLESRWAFLLAVNVFLLIVGCLMDIFSAIAVVVPLLLPVAKAFGVSKVHLGIIFLANMELGYLTPPVGMNLFLAAYRFEKPMMQICRNVLPFLLILLGAVLVITYAPALLLGAGDAPSIAPAP